MALALAGCPASTSGTAGASGLALASASRQTGRAGAPVNSGPAVRVLDPSGDPVAGVEVEFTAAGGGSATPATATSGADGVARTTWTLGAGGAQSLRAAAPGTAAHPVTFEADILPSTGYRVDLRLLTAASDAQWQAFTDAAARIGQVIVGQLDPVDVGGIDCDGTAVSGSVEDVLILVKVQTIDGPGGILGQAGPCAVRASSRLPAVGVMEFDSADLDRLAQSGRLGNVILHEMVHVVGFGTVWDAYSRSPLPALDAGEGTASSVFTGPQALAAAIASNGAPATWTTVPLENCGSASPQPCGAGTRDAHWLEPTFRNELMTGWISGTTQPLSSSTIGSLADLGYSVDNAAADAFDLATAGVRGEAAGAGEPGEPVGDDVLQLPVTVVP